MSTSVAAAVVTNGLEREYACWQLRCQGATYQQIADQLGLGSRSAAWNSIQKVRQALREEIRESYVEYIEMQLERYDQIIRAHMPKVHDPQSAAIVLRTEAQRAQLLGLNAPERKDVTPTQPLTFRLIEEPIAVKGEDE